MENKLIERIKSFQSDRKKAFNSDWNFKSPFYIVSEDELKELSEINIELLKACTNFINAPKSRTFGYYSDQQIDALDNMKKAMQ